MATPPTSFEQKIALLVLSNPKERAELLNKWSSDTELHLAFNARTMPFDQYMQLKAHKFKEVADRAKEIRKNMKNHGWTDKKYQKYIGELPEDLFFDRPEFSTQLPRKQLDANIRWFLSAYPQFKVCD